MLPVLMSQELVDTARQLIKAQNHFLATNFIVVAVGRMIT